MRISIEELQIFLTNAPRTIFLRSAFELYVTTKREQKYENPVVNFQKKLTTCLHLIATEKIVAVIETEVGRRAVSSEGSMTYAFKHMRNFFRLRILLAIGIWAFRL